MREWALSTRARFAPDFVDLRTDALVLGILGAQTVPSEPRLVNQAAVAAMPGIVRVITARDVPAYLFTTAGQPEPEPSPYDTQIINRTVRYIGEPVALLAAETPEDLVAALRQCQVEYTAVEGGELHPHAPHNVLYEWDVAPAPGAVGGGHQETTEPGDC
jgi:putative selenate reductase molybdopterin-binding subunit